MSTSPLLPHHPSLKWHPTRAIAALLRRDGSLAWLDGQGHLLSVNPERIAALGPTLAHSDDALLIATSGAELQLYEWGESSPVARIKRPAESGPCHHLDASQSGQWILAAAPGTPTQLLHWRTRKRQHINHPHHQLAAATVSAGGAWAALALTEPRRGGKLQVWALHDHGRATLHMDALDRRHATGPTRALRGGQIALKISQDEQVLFSYESSLTLADAPLESGWIGVARAYELRTGRQLWEAHLDEHTHAAQHLLTPEDTPEGSPGALWESSAAQTLLVASYAGVLVGLDTRDGALRALSHVGTSRPIVSITRAPSGALWALNDHGLPLRTAWDCASIEGIDAALARHPQSR